MDRFSPTPSLSCSFPSFHIHPFVSLGHSPNPFLRHSSSLFLVCSSPLSSVTRESMERSGQGRDEPRENRGEGHAVRSILSLPSSLSLHSFHGMPTAPFGHSVAHSGLVTSLRSIPHLSTHSLPVSLIASSIDNRKDEARHSPIPSSLPSLRLVVHSGADTGWEENRGKRKRQGEERRDRVCGPYRSLVPHSHTHTH